MPKIKFKNKTFASNVFYAPLAGCSDYPYRKMAQKYHPGLVFCEMVKMDALMRMDTNTFRLLDYDPSMHPIGAQICGSKLHLVRGSAKIIEDLGFDLIDLNCGCPVDKVTKDGSGSGLLKNPNLIGEIIDEMVSAVSIPVTVKIRAGWDDEQIVGPVITKIAEDAGASAIFVHGRTRAQAYKGPANWQHIKDCVDAASSIKVFGNGDIFEPGDAIRMLEETGCDGVLVSRGTFGQPWIAQDIQKLQAGDLLSAHKDLFIIDNLLEHYGWVKRYSHEKKAIVDMRRVGCWYIQKGEVARDFRRRISKVKTLQEVDELLSSLQVFDNHIKESPIAKT